MTGRNQLTPGGAWAVGAAAAACGVFPILVGVGVVQTGDRFTPAWVIIAIGLLFVCAGAAIIVDYALAGGIGPGGDLPEGTPIGIRVANLLLGITIIALMTSVFAWVAFGHGPRAFSTTTNLPFVPAAWRSGERSGRIAFGVVSVLMFLMLVFCSVSGVRRILTAARKGSPRLRQ